MLDKSGWLLEMPNFEGKKTLGRRLSMRKVKPKKYWYVVTMWRRERYLFVPVFLPPPSLICSSSLCARLPLLLSLHYLSLLSLSLSHPSFPSPFKGTSSTASC